MEAKWIQKILKVGTSYAAVLPATIMRQMNWERGDAIVVSAISDRVITIELLGSYMNSLPQTKSDKKIVKIK